jgi:hypothetical protein
MSRTKNSRPRRKQGMNWIRQEKRLAIYLRDGMACAYCGASVEDGTKLTLDHITPYVKGGSNHESNLVTCCLTCNSSRGARAMRTFAAAVAEYRGIDVAEIIKHVNRTRARVLPMDEAKKLIERRGSAAKALASL